MYILALWGERKLFLPTPAPRYRMFYINLVLGLSGWGYRSGWETTVKVEPALCSSEETKEGFKENFPRERATASLFYSLRVVRKPTPEPSFALKLLKLYTRRSAARTVTALHETLSMQSMDDMNTSQYR